MSRPQGRFSEPERQAVYRAIFERRDVRRNFLPRSIPEAVMRRLLTAAHHAGSVGFMQPWDFIVIRNPETKHAVKELFLDANTKAARRYRGAKGELYRRLKLEGIEEAPINLCITCSRRRGGRMCSGVPPYVRRIYTVPVVPFKISGWPPGLKGLGWDGSVFSIMRH